MFGGWTEVILGVLTPCPDHKRVSGEQYRASDRSRDCPSVPLKETKAVISGES